jgi:two-component system, NarL family, sensor kinase
MPDRVRRGGLTAVAVLGTVAVVVGMTSMWLRGRPLVLSYELFMFHNGPSAVVLVWMSRLVLRRQPRHRAGLVLLLIGALDAVHVVTAALFDARLVAGGIDIALDPDFATIPAALPLDAAIAQLVLATVWVPSGVLALTLLLLLFPDGRLPGPRWRPVAGLAVAGATLLAVSFAVDAWPTADWAVGNEPTGVLLLMAIGGLAVLLASAASVVALVRRWWRHRADPVPRRQFRTVGVAAIVFAAVATATYPWPQVWIPATLVAFNALLVAYALAAARYRLHDLEPVLGRTAVGAILAVLVTGVYLVVVVGVGSLVGRGAEGTLLPLVAVGVVALLVEPARRRARRLVDRLLYGRRADRTEVLARLAAQASTAAGAEVLGEVAQLLVRSTGAARAEVWQAVEPQPRLGGVAGESDEPEPVLRADVHHRGERLGELRLFARVAADLAPDASRLLADVAHSLGVVLRNARLTAQLGAQLEELQASRQRLVQVHDQARRGLERDIHDGAQARLVSLRLRIGLLRALAGTGDLDAVAEQLDSLAQEVDAAVRSLRELARGLHPPILEQSGVAAALRANLRDLPLRVTVNAAGVGRYPRAVEGAVYFSCLEAVQNAVRHSGAEQIRVDLAADGAGLRFRVGDDGTGFDPDRIMAGAGLVNISDRVSALGGQVRVDSSPEAGTVVGGEIPAQPLVEDR